MASRKPAPLSKTWFLVIELLGLGLSGYLFLVSTDVIGGGQLPCKKSAWISCTDSIKGSLSHIGPFSVAAMGCIYFLLQLMLTAGMRDRAAQLLKLLLIAGGLIFLAWLRSLEFVHLKKICPWCWGVAFLTLIHAGFLWTLAVPPLPRLRPLGIAASIAGGFIVLVAIVTLAELAVGTGRMLQRQGHSDKYADESSSNSSAESPPSSKTSVKSTAPPARPTSTPRPASQTATPSPTPDLTARPPGAAPSGSETALPTPLVTATPGAPKTAAQFDPEPQLEDSPDVRVLRKRGWRHAGSGASVIKAIKARPPILLLAYNPFCSDCERLIMKVLDTDQIENLPVTKICIQEEMINGQISEWVHEFPSMFLIDSEGTQVWKKVGSTISAEQMAKEITTALGAAR